LDENWLFFDLLFNHLELKKGVGIKGQKEAFASLSPMMRGLVDDVRTVIMAYNGYIFIMDLRDLVEKLRR